MAGEDGWIEQQADVRDASAELAIASTRLLKIDAECHEASVFKGGKTVFRCCLPSVVIFEFKQWAILFWERPLIHLLDD